MLAFHRNAGLAALSFALLSGPAFAEDVIVVTATRTPTPLQRLPARVDVIDRAEIDAKGLVTLADALRLAPGVSVSSTGGWGAQTSVFSRGANSAHTLALFDGIRINDPATPNGQYDFGQDTLGDLERVEVLRGPASSVYGADAVGGVVNLVPRRGADKALAPYFDVSAGSFGGMHALAGAAGTEGALSWGATVDAVRTEGFDQLPKRFTTRTGDKDGADIETATVNASYALGDGYAVDGLFRHRTASVDFDSFSGGPSGFQRADDPSLRDDRDTSTIWRLGAQHEGEALTVRLDGGEVRNDRTEKDGTATTGDIEARRAFADLAVSVRRTAFGPFADATLTGGLQYSDDRIDTAATSFNDAVRKSERNGGLFAVAQGRVGAGTDLTASVRIDDNRDYDTQTTGTFGVSQDLTAFGAPVRVHASYGTSYKAPTLQERYGTSLFNVGNPGLQPEEGRSAEIGVDWTPTPALRLAVTAFDTRLRNLIDYDFATLRNINIDRARTRGVESSVEGDFGDRASLRVTYVYTDARDTSAPGAPRLLRRPPHAWSIDGLFDVTDRLRLHAGWSWVSAHDDVTYDNDGFFLTGRGRSPGHDVGTAAIDFALTDALTLYAVARNVADETYEDPNAYRGAPRTVMVGLRGKY